MAQPERAVILPRMDPMVQRETRHQADPVVVVGDLLFKPRPTVAMAVTAVSTVAEVGAAVCGMNPGLGGSGGVGGNGAIYVFCW